MQGMPQVGWRRVRFSLGGRDDMACYRSVREEGERNEADVGWQRVVA